MIGNGISAASLRLWTMGSRHKGKAAVVKVDLKDFFPSIKFRRVKGGIPFVCDNGGWLHSCWRCWPTETPSRRHDRWMANAALCGASGDRARRLSQGACTSPCAEPISSAIDGLSA